MPSGLWEHTRTTIFIHGSKAEVGIILRSWVKHYKLEDFTSLLESNIEDFQPAGSLSTSKEKADSEEVKMPPTPLREI